MVRKSRVPEVRKRFKGLGGKEEVVEEGRREKKKRGGRRRGVRMRN
jgi:hypothetical protein